MPPRMIEEWLTSEDITELQAYYSIRSEDEGARRAAEQTEAMARKRGR